MDTITAIATPQGVGGLSVIRISGDDAIEIAAKVFRSKKSITEKESHTITFGYVVDADGEKIDECLASVFLKPHSFTGENVCEISCHGGILGTRRILDAIINAGARMAQGGEFTKRAFLNGKLSLTQAEAVKDIIDARTDGALFAAVNRLEGGINKEICAIRDSLLQLYAFVQAESDFPDEDTTVISESEIEERIKQFIAELERLKKSATRGILLREGATCAIVGRPNTGKSSLFNALLDQSRAIVTDVEGTTRDIVEEWIDIEGIPVKIGDTAGIRESSDIVEQIGVSKSKEYINKADICLFVIEAGSEMNSEEKEILEIIKDSRYITVINKCDKNEDNREGIKVSALEKKGIDELKKEIAKELGAVNTRETVLANARQLEAVNNALNSLKRAEKSLLDGYFYDLAAIDIFDAIGHLGEAEGMSVNEETVNRIFEEFCLGK